MSNIKLDIAGPLTILIIYYNFLILAEQELEKLQRQYRVMDGERRAYCEESQNIIRKQQYAV